MVYMLKAGVLYAGPGVERPLVSIRGKLCGPRRQIVGPDDKLLLSTDIRWLDTQPRETGDLRYKEYIMYTAEGRAYAVARPGYAGGEDPAETGWPICRMPRSDHALLTVDGQRYTLVMESVQHYRLMDDGGRCAVQIAHLGVAGGWKLELDAALSAPFLCGLFIFCRYLEKENEFAVV